MYVYIYIYLSLSFFFRAPARLAMWGVGASGLTPSTCPGFRVFGHTPQFFPQPTRTSEGVSNGYEPQHSETPRARPNGPACARAWTCLMICSCLVDVVFKYV